MQIDRQQKATTLGIPHPHLSLQQTLVHPLVNGIKPVSTYRQVPHHHWEPPLLLSALFIFISTSTAHPHSNPVFLIPNKLNILITLETDHELLGFVLFPSDF